MVFIQTIRPEVQALNQPNPNAKLIVSYNILFIK